MILQWKPFKISLRYFNKFLAESIPEADGIVATTEHFEIIEKTPLSQQHIEMINNYYNELDEQTELRRWSRPANLSLAYLNCKEAIISKQYDQLTTLERKVLTGLDLNESEEDQLLDLYP